MAYRSGFIAIVGRPNVGKSTLINALIGKKVAITSDKPQTTRHRINGLITTEDYQMIFVDTPGMHKGKDLLNQTIDKIAVQSLQDVDLILFVVDKKFGAAEAHIIKYFEHVQVPIFLLINKIDQYETKSEIDSLILTYLNTYNFEGYYPISAKDKTHLDRLKNDLVPYLPEGPQYYPQEMQSDQSETTLMSEFIREKILSLTEQEVPHAVAVVIERLEENHKNKTLDVDALIIVERASQKKILIGHQGDKIKQIGMLARKEINYELGRKIHLSLWIKIKKDWRNRESDLKAYGVGDF
ncbi:MAG: GTPase Era [Acholeplasmataceae bacterium]